MVLAYMEMYFYANNRIYGARTFEKEINNSFIMHYHLLCPNRLRPFIGAVGWAWQ